MADSLPCAAETQHYKAITLQFKKNKNTYLTFSIHFEHFSKKQTKKGKVIMETEVG